MRAFALVFVLACVACSGSGKPRQSALSSTWSAPSMLAKVPADSPYLVAILDPMPQMVRDQTSASLDAKLELERARLELEANTDRSTLPVKDRMLLALFDELEGKDMTNWGRELGFDPNGRFVLYGLSVWPVLRIATSNDARLRQVIGNIITKSGAPATQHTLQGRTYWQFGDAKISGIISVGDGEVVGAVLPTPALAQHLPIVLGLQRPPRSLNDDNKLSTLVGRYRFLPTMIGYIDAKIAADILAQRAPSTNTELDRPLRTAMGPVDQTCRTDLDRIVALAPRMVFGYRRLDAKGLQGTFVLEMPPAITAALQRLRVSVPDLEPGLGERSLIRFGIAAKLDELLPLLQQLTDHIERRPFQCGWFASLNEGAAELGKLLDQPLPAPLLGFRGMSFVLDDLTQNPTNPRGHAVLVGDHASDLLAVMLKLLPGMAGTTVPPDGRPVQLPLIGLGVPANVLGYAATRVDRASIAVGPNSAADVVKTMKLPLPKRSPLMSMSFDMKRMVELGLVKRDDTGGMRHVSLQLEVGPEGLLVEMYGAFPAQ
jgi:hypothetical protein